MWLKVYNEDKIIRKKTPDHVMYLFIGLDMFKLKQNFLVD